jgi:SAM-dependent methyltransferase
MPKNLEPVQIIINSRNSIIRKRNGNLRYLLKMRYDWIRQFITTEETGLELGSGAGHSRIYMKGYNFITTDIYNLQWIDEKNIDAQHTPFKDASYDYIFIKNVLHHLDQPVLFFEEAGRLLKKGGRIIIFEPYASLAMQLAIKISGHEHYDNKADVLDPGYSLYSYSDKIIDGNNSVGRILFDHPERFLAKYDHYEMLHKSYSEFFIFLNSGGVYKKFLFVPLFPLLLKILNKIDKGLVKIAPRVFALAIRVVLVKK